jgi:hypothetical protein
MKIYIAIIAACAGGLVLSQANFAQAQQAPVTEKTSPEQPKVTIKEPMGGGMVAATTKADPLSKQENAINTSRSNINR